MMSQMGGLQTFDNRILNGRSPPIPAVRPTGAQSVGGALRKMQPEEIGKRRMKVVTPAKAGVQSRRRRLLENQSFSVS